MNRQTFFKDSQTSLLKTKSWSEFVKVAERVRVLEAMIAEENKGRGDMINKTKVKVFCETRWIERHVVLEEVQLLYEPILKTLEKISSEKGWDRKTMDQAHVLTKNLTESTFLVALRVVHTHLALQNH